MPFPNNGNPSPKTIKIERYLVEAHEVGKVISYEQLETVIGESVRVGKRGFGYLRTARQRILTSHGFHTITIAGVGIKFPTAEEHLADSANQRRFINRKSRRAGRAAETLRMEDLSDADKSFHLSNVGIFNAMHHITSSHAHKRLRTQLAPSNILPDAKTLLEHLK